MKRIINLFLCLFVFTIAATYTSFLLGSKYFLLPIDLPSNYWVDGIVSTFLFFVSSLLTSAAAIRKINKEIILYNIFLVVAFQIYFIFYQNPIVAFVLTTIEPFCVVWAYGIAHNKDVIKSSVNCLLLIIVTFLYHKILTPVKMNILPFSDLIPIFILAKIAYQVDFLIFFSISSIKMLGGNAYVALEHRILPQDFQSAQLDSEDVQALKEVTDLPQRQRVLTALIFIGFQVFQFLLILLVGKLGNRLIETLVVSLSFILFGLIIKRRWHSKSVLFCTFLSVATFYIASHIIPTYNYCQFLPILIGFEMTYIFCRLAIITERGKEDGL